MINKIKEIAKKIEEVAKKLDASKNRFVAGAELAAMLLIATPNTAEAQPTNKSNMVVILSDADLYRLFGNSPYLYQHYEGSVDKFIKDFRDQEKQYAAGKAKASTQQILDIIKKRDNIYFDSLCEGGSVDAKFDYKVEKDAQGERKLVPTEESYVVCESESGYTEVFVFDRTHCVPDRRVCIPHAFGKDMMCGCHGDHDIDPENELSPILERGSAHENLMNVIKNEKIKGQGR